MSKQNLPTHLKARAGGNPHPGTHQKYPFKCLVLEGGGAKGGLYPGAIQALEDEGIMKYINRFAGASAGALVATMLAIGFSSAELKAKLAESDMSKIVTPNWAQPRTAQQKATALATIGLAPLGKLCRNLCRLATSFGYHSGDRLLEFIDGVIASKLGQKLGGITFKNLYDWYKVELSIVVTNVNRGVAEYMHVKTTPHVEIRRAVRMSMSLPLLLKPEKLNPDQGGASETLAHYVDGGLFQNYPIDAFDGWWLSMNPRDSHLVQLAVTERGRSQREKYMHRFDGANLQTLGFRLCSAADRDPRYKLITHELQDMLHGESVEHVARRAVALPSTKLATKYESSDRSRKKTEKQEDELHDLNEAVRFLMRILCEVLPKDSEGLVEGKSSATIKDLRSAIEKAEEERKAQVSGSSSKGSRSGDGIDLRVGIDTLLYRFGFTDIAALLKHLDKDDSGMINLNEVEMFFNEQHYIASARLHGWSPAKVSSFGGFLRSMVDGVQLAAEDRNMKPEHIDRTCVLNSEYVDVSDFKLDPKDVDFLHDKGRETTKQWLVKWLEDPGETYGLFKGSLVADPEPLRRRASDFEGQMKAAAERDDFVEAGRLQKQMQAITEQLQLVEARRAKLDGAGSKQ